MREIKIRINKKVVAILVPVCVVTSYFITGIVVSQNKSTATTSDMFISVWDTSKTSRGSSLWNQVSLPLISNGTYNFTVDWGDGFHSRITTWNSIYKTHWYFWPGTYKIKISGTLIGWSFNNKGDKLKLMDIQQWGNLRLGNSGNYFDGCFYLNITAKDNLNIIGMTNFSGMFKKCYHVNYIENISNWDVSNVTDMSYMFSGSDEVTQFNQPLNNWNVSSVTDMSHMFNYASSFNQPIGSWNVSSVTDMNGMFSYADSFNQPIDSWNVLSVTDMSHMFDHDSSFNQDIGSWDVSKTMYMTRMFSGVTLSTSNYDNLLNGWSQLHLQKYVRFDAGNSKYTVGASAAMQKIISNFHWTIDDGGPS